MKIIIVFYSLMTWDRNINVRQCLANVYEEIMRALVWVYVVSTKINMSTILVGPFIILLPLYHCKYKGANLLFFRYFAFLFWKKQNKKNNEIKFKKIKKYYFVFLGYFILFYFLFFVKLFVKVENFFQRKNKHWARPKYNVTDHQINLCKEWF